MKDTPTLAASPISQEALDSLLITAAGNPQGEARDENRLTQTVSGLLARGANVNAVTSDGFTALMIAARNGHTEIFSTLLSCEGIDVDAVRPDDVATLGLTALMLAAQNGHTEIVSALLSRKGVSEVNVNASQNDGHTALMLAVENGHTEIVLALLLSRRVYVNVATSDGLTILMIAAENGHTEMVSALLSYDGIGTLDIDVNAVRRGYGPNLGTTALILAAQKGHTETVLTLLSREGIDVNSVTSDEFTALMLAALNGHAEIVSALLSREGIDVNAARSDGFTALMIAAINGHAETVSALLSRDGVDWQIVQDQLNHPVLRNLNKEVSVLLAFILPEGETRNSIITSFNQRNPNDAIQQENWAGPEMYKTLKDLKSWHVRYLTDSGVEENEAKILANQRFFDLLNHQDRRQETLARNDLVTDLVSKSESLAADFERIATNFPEIEDQKALDAVGELSPEDLYKLTTKIIDKSKDGNGIPTLQASSLVALLRNFEIPATTMHRDSAATIAEPIVTPRQNGGHSFRC